MTQDYRRELVAKLLDFRNMPSQAQGVREDGLELTPTEKFALSMADMILPEECPKAFIMWMMDDDAFMFDASDAREHYHQLRNVLLGIN